MFKYILPICLIGLLGRENIFAQIKHPRISPQATLIQQVGLTEVKIEYSRPGVRGRKIMGNVVPYGRIWRVGANESTKVYFSDSVKIQKNYLSPGVYALYAIPEENEWTIIFHRNISHWGDGRLNYNAEEDAIRFKVIPWRTSQFAETFTIEFDKLTHQSAEMHLTWENTRISFLIEVDTRSKMMHEIKYQIASQPNEHTYYEAARYLQEENINPEQARQWLIKAHELAGDTYYIHRVWSLVEAQLGNYKAAITHAEKSKVLAAAEGKDEFVRMNQENINNWRLKINIK